MSKSLGEFEQLVLFAVLRLEETAYGASIRDDIEGRTGRPVAAGAVYTALDRMEGRGLVTSRIGEPTAARGGRRKKFYDLEPAGLEALADAWDTLRRMSEGLADRLTTRLGGARGA